MAPKKRKKAAPLTKADREKLKQLLLSQRARLTRDMDSLKADTSRGGEQDFSVDHMADHGSDNFEQDFNLGLIENTGQTLRAIDRALAEMERGEYGKCGACGEDIPRARMEYIPWARFCVACQTRYEKGELPELEE